jgi:hypothetical protein
MRSAAFNRGLLVLGNPVGLMLYVVATLHYILLALQCPLAGAGSSSTTSVFSMDVSYPEVPAACWCPVSLP